LCARLPNLTIETPLTSTSLSSGGTCDKLTTRERRRDKICRGRILSRYFSSAFESVVLSKRDGNKDRSNIAPFERVLFYTRRRLKNAQCCSRRRRRRLGGLIDGGRRLTAATVSAESARRRCNRLCVCMCRQMFAGPCASAVPLMTVWFTLQCCVVRVGQASVSPGQFLNLPALSLSFPLSLFLSLSLSVSLA